MAATVDFLHTACLPLLAKQSLASLTFCSRNLLHLSCCTSRSFATRPSASLKSLSITWLLPTTVATRGSTVAQPLQTSLNQLSSSCLQVFKCLILNKTQHPTSHVEDMGTSNGWLGHPTWICFHEPGTGSHRNQNITSSVLSSLLSYFQTLPTTLFHTKCSRRTVLWDGIEMDRKPLYREFVWNHQRWLEQGHANDQHQQARCQVPGKQISFLPLVELGNLLTRVSIESSESTVIPLPSESQR